MWRERQHFQGQKAKGESTKTKIVTENQSQAIWQTNHSVSRISFPSWKAWGNMIHDLVCCSWLVWYIFHSTCSFNVSRTIKQGPFTVAAFSFRLWPREDFCLLCWSISCLPTTAHVFCMMLWLNMLIFLQDVQFNLSSVLLLQLQLLLQFLQICHQANHHQSPFNTSYFLKI